ncbi:hypothetical protein ACFQX6_28125 [Streptosporangium lutulentum]
MPDRLRGELTARRGWIETDVETAARLLATALTEFENDPARAARVGTELAQRVGVLLLRLTEAKTVARKAVRQARRAESPAVLRGALATEGFLAALAGRPDAVGFCGTRSPWPVWRACLFPTALPRAAGDVAHVARGTRPCQRVASRGSRGG